jgi:predicted DNA-binding transcriptional regulator AlpA
LKVHPNSSLPSTELNRLQPQHQAKAKKRYSIFGNPPRRVAEVEPLLTAEDVAKRLNVSTDWVWDHSSRKKPLLPVIRMGDGALRYRASGIEAFIDEREWMSAMRRRAS